MYRKIVILLGSAAVIASLMMPPTQTIDTGKVSSWSGRPVMQATNDYGKLTIRTIAIIVAAGTLYLLIPKAKKE